MLLSDALRRLGTGELASYYVGSNILSPDCEEDWPILIDHINTALTKLYTRFPLRIETLVLQQYAHISKYELSSKHAETNKESKSQYKYIKDSVYEPFTDNLLRIERIEDELMVELPLNDNFNAASVYTPKFNVLQVPFPQREKALYVSYRAGHTKLDVTTKNPEAHVIELPEYLEEALFAYVAHRYLAGKNTELTRAMASAEYGKYSSICNDVESNDLLRQSSTSPNRHPCIQGWV